MLNAKANFTGHDDGVHLVPLAIVAARATDDVF
jgi:hypothetical protein